MKYRQLKKLCKKSAEIMGFKGCELDEGLWWVVWRDFDGGYDAEEAWYFIEERFNGDVNAAATSDGDIYWKNEKQWKAATPENVFKWAKETLLKGDL